MSYRGYDCCSIKQQNTSGLMGNFANKIFEISKEEMRGVCSEVHSKEDSSSFYNPYHTSWWSDRELRTYSNHNAEGLGTL